MMKNNPYFRGYFKSEEGQGECGGDCETCKNYAVVKDIPTCYGGGYEEKEADDEESNAD